MSQEILKIKLMSVKDCFLRFSSSKFPNIVGTSVYAIKLSIGEKDYFFSPYHKPSVILSDAEVGLSATYAKCLKLEENDCVIVTALNNVGSVSKIYASPVTEEDLEILGSSTGEIEKLLLNQLRIVWPGQIFPVWLSQSLSVQLAVIDYLFPNLNCGRLEEYSEVLIQDVIKKTPKDNTKSIRSHIQESLIFRCVSLEGAIKIKPSPFGYSQWHLKPYEVYINYSSSPMWLVSLLQNNETSLWVLTESENAISMDKRVSEGNEEIPSSRKKEGLIVRLRFPEKSVIGMDAGKFQSLFVSKYVRTYLNLRLNSKVVLKQIGETRTKNVTGIILTPFSKKTPFEAGMIENAFKKNLSNLVGQSKTVLINSKGPFPLSENESVMVTLRPLDTRWELINRNDLKNIKITVAKLNSEISFQPENVEEKKKHQNAIPSFERLLEEMFFSIDASFALSSGLKQNLISNFMENILIVGKPGGGKTTLVELFREKISLPPYSVHSLLFDCRLLKGKRIEYFSKVLNELLTVCEYYQPSILFLDNISSIASVPKTDQENTEASFHMKRISYKLAELIENYQNDNFILVIGTTDSATKVNSRLLSPRGKSAFTTMINIPDLVLEDRSEFLNHLLCEKAPHTRNHLPCLELNHFASLFEGYVARDLVRLAMKALFEAWQRKVEQNGPLVISKSDLEAAHLSSAPAALQGLPLHKGPKFTFTDIGGLKNVKEQLIQVIIWPTLYPNIMSQCPLKLQNAILLYGFPGTGKTLLASAVAGESKLNFITVKGPELMSKYIGESEEAVRKLFERAQAAKPCLLFFDEFDSLAPRRGKDQVGVTDRVVNQFLTALDGVEPMTGVMVLAATNRPDIIDPALLRPGRIGTYVFCDLPNKNERLEILQKLCAKLLLAKDVNLEIIAEKTEDFSGADLKGLVTSSQIRTVDKLVEFRNETEPFLKWTDTDSTPQITQSDLLEALTETKPSLSSKEKLNLINIYKNFIMGSVPDISEQKMTFA